MDINETNQLLRQLSYTFDNLFLKRLTVESKIFPVNEYIMVACLNSYSKFYQQLKLVNEKISPEEIANKQKKLFTEITPLQIFDLQMFPLFGRTIYYCQHGNDPTCESFEKFQETQFILDFWRRLAKTYFGTGALTIEEMDGMAKTLPESDLKFIKQQLFTPEKQDLSKIKRASAQLEVYCFMDECEARMKISDHGPYAMENGELLVVREIVRLNDGKNPQWPWSNTKAVAPTTVIAFAFTLKDMNRVWFNDWGTLFTDPVDYSKNITSAAVLTREMGQIKALGVDELKLYEEFAQNALIELYRKMTKWSRAEKMKAGILVYNKNFDRFTSLIGITDQIDWDLTEEIERHEFKDLVNKRGKSVYAPLGWIFRGPRARKKNPTFFLREIEE
ncbi:MAG: hypothetical protein HWN65_11285 [Candidatus Helarchaeota archaeon]|nr:hypothetical protein [Candidatus Helarchaeota archaeon]